MPPDFTPSVGRDVHYTAPGSADGTFPLAHRAAKITSLGSDDDDRQCVNLIVFNPQGIHFPMRVPRDDTATKPYTWHVPERV